MNYLWDTNIAIYYLQQQFPLPVEKFIDEVLLTNQPVFSVITEIELLCWNAKAEDDMRVIRDFIKEATILELDNPVKNKTIELRKTLGIKLPDAVIAATALVYDLTLLTRNTRDFVKDVSLKVINPFELK